MSVLCHLALRIVARTGNEHCFLNTRHRFFARLSVCTQARESEINLEHKQTKHQLNDAAMCQALFTICYGGIIKYFYLSTDET